MILNPAPGPPPAPGQLPLQAILPMRTTTRIQAFTCIYLGSNFDLTEATLVKLFYLCTQCKVHSLHFVPDLGKKAFKFQVIFEDGNIWELQDNSVDTDNNHDSD